MIMWIFPATIGLTFTAAAAMLNAKSSVLDENTLIPLSVFVAGVTVLVSSAWLLSAKVQKILSKIEEVERRTRDLEKELHKWSRHE